MGSEPGARRKAGALWRKEHPVLPRCAQPNVATCPRGPPAARCAAILAATSPGRDPVRWEPIEIALGRAHANYRAAGNSGVSHPCD